MEKFKFAHTRVGGIVHELRGTCKGKEECLRSFLAFNSD